MIYSVFDFTNFAFGGIMMASAFAGYFATQVGISTPVAMLVASAAGFAISVIGLALLTGYTGMFSLGHAGFMCIGAYAAVLTNRYWGLPFALSMLFGGILAAVIALIIGSNGAGKSTLLRTIAGDKALDRGSISFRGEPLPTSVHEVVAGGISLVPEGRRIFPALTVKENLILGTCSKKNYRSIMNSTLEEVFALFPIFGSRADHH